MSHAPKRRPPSLLQRDADLDRFVARLRARLEVGASRYGNTSSPQAPAEFIKRDLGDIAGPGLIVPRQPAAPTDWDRRTGEGTYR